MSMRSATLRLVVTGAAVLVGTFTARAQTYPPGFTATELLASSFSGATSMALSPDGHIYIAQHSGEVRVWGPVSGLAPSPFFTFPVQYAGERGLIGIAVDPDWSSNHYIYAHYSRSSPANGAVIKRLTASAADPSVPVAGSEVTLLDLGDYATTTPAHVGGGMHFGPDGKLYVGVGDNAFSSTTSQSLANPWGKLLRITADPADPIPTDNPTTFAGIAGSPTGNNRIIWAVGLRNPFSFAFQPGSGRLFINDVGQGDWEEIDEGAPGVNYGWPDTEGDFSQALFPDYTRPFYTYNHATGPVVGQCIVGATFYNPPEHTFPPAYFGDFLFGDYVAGWVKSIDTASKTVSDFAAGVDMVVDLMPDAQGRLLILCDGAPARLIRVQYTAPLAPTILTQPVSLSVGAGGTAQFSVSAAGNNPLSYQWRRNGVNLTDGGDYAGAATPTLTISGVDCSNAGDYDCVVSNPAGTATSTAVALNGAVACYPNCDCSAAAPALNIADFTCFLQRYAAGDPYANCDNSPVVPTLNIADFTCFLQSYAAGCP